MNTIRWDITACVDSGGVAHMKHLKGHKELIVIEKEGTYAISVHRNEETILSRFFDDEDKALIFCRRCMA